MFCLAAEVLNLRKIMVPAIIAGLGAIFYINSLDWTAAGPVVISGLNMSHMMHVDHFSVAFSGLSIFAAALIFALSADYYKDEQHHLSDYLAILIFVLCGTLVLFSYWNLVMLFLGIEIVAKYWMGDYLSEGLLNGKKRSCSCRWMLNYIMYFFI